MASLLWAACNGELPVVKLLLDRGANMEVTNRIHPPLPPLTHWPCVCVCVFAVLVRVRVRECVCLRVCVHLCLLYTALKMNWVQRVSCSSNLYCRMGSVSVFVFVSACVCVWPFVCVRACVFVCVRCACVCVSVCLCLSLYVCLYVCLCVCTCVCLCVCLCAYSTHTHPHRVTGFNRHLPFMRLSPKVISLW